VGIIGANPDRGWAAQAHIPALKSLSDDFEITALSTFAPRDERTERTPTAEGFFNSSPQSFVDNDRMAASESM
jgi:predicted dehydrogenase